MAEQEQVNSILFQNNRDFNNFYVYCEVYNQLVAGGGKHFQALLNAKPEVAAQLKDLSKLKRAGLDRIIFENRGLFGLNVSNRREFNVLSNKANEIRGNNVAPTAAQVNEEKAKYNKYLEDRNKAAIESRQNADKAFIEARSKRRKTFGRRLGWFMAGLAGAALTGGVLTGLGFGVANVITAISTSVFGIASGAAVAGIFVVAVSGYWLYKGLAKMFSKISDKFRAAGADRRAAKQAAREARRARRMARSRERSAMQDYRYQSNYAEYAPYPGQESNLPQNQQRARAQQNEFTPEDIANARQQVGASEYAERIVDGQQQPQPGQQPQPQPEQAEQQPGQQPQQPAQSRTPVEEQHLQPEQPQPQTSVEEQEQPVEYQPVPPAGGDGNNGNNGNEGNAAPEEEREETPAPATIPSVIALNNAYEDYLVASNDVEEKRAAAKKVVGFSERMPKKVYDALTPEDRKLVDDYRASVEVKKQKDANLSRAMFNLAEDRSNEIPQPDAKNLRTYRRWLTEHGVHKDIVAETTKHAAVSAVLHQRKYRKVTLENNNKSTFEIFQTEKNGIKRDAESALKTLGLESSNMSGVVQHYVDMKTEDAAKRKAAEDAAKRKAEEENMAAEQNAHRETEEGLYAGLENAINDYNTSNETCQKIEKRLNDLGVSRPKTGSTWNKSDASAGHKKDIEQLVEQYNEAAQKRDESLRRVAEYQIHDGPEPETPSRVKGADELQNRYELNDLLNRGIIKRGSDIDNFVRAQNAVQEALANGVVALDDATEKEVEAVVDDLAARKVTTKKNAREVIAVLKGENDSTMRLRGQPKKKKEEPASENTDQNTPEQPQTEEQQNQEQTNGQENAPENAEQPEQNVPEEPVVEIEAEHMLDYLQDMNGVGNNGLNQRRANVQSYLANVVEVANAIDEEGNVRLRDGKKYHVNGGKVMLLGQAQGTIKNMKSEDWDKYGEQGNIKPKQSALAPSEPEVTEQNQEQPDQNSGRRSLGDRIRGLFNRRRGKEQEAQQESESSAFLSAEFSDKEREWLSAEGVKNDEDLNRFMTENNCDLETLHQSLNNFISREQNSERQTEQPEQAAENAEQPEVIENSEQNTTEQTENNAQENVEEQTEQPETVENAEEQTEQPETVENAEEQTEQSETVENAEEQTEQTDENDRDDDNTPPTGGGTPAQEEEQNLENTGEQQTQEPVVHEPAVEEQPEEQQVEQPQPKSAEPAAAQNDGYVPSYAVTEVQDKYLLNIFPDLMAKLENIEEEQKQDDKRLAQNPLTMKSYTADSERRRASRNIVLQKIDEEHDKVEQIRQSDKETQQRIVSQGQLYSGAKYMTDEARDTAAKAGLVPDENGKYQVTSMTPEEIAAARKNYNKWSESACNNELEIIKIAEQRAQGVYGKYVYTNFSYSDEAVKDLSDKVLKLCGGKDNPAAQDLAIKALYAGRLMIVLHNKNMTMEQFQNMDPKQREEVARDLAQAMNGGKRPSKEQMQAAEAFCDRRVKLAKEGVKADNIPEPKTITNAQDLMAYLSEHNNLDGKRRWNAREDRQDLANFLGAVQEITGQIGVSNGGVVTLADGTKVQLSNPAEVEALARGIAPKIAGIRGVAAVKGNKEEIGNDYLLSYDIEGLPKPQGSVVTKKKPNISHLSKEDLEEALKADEVTVEGTPADPIGRTIDTAVEKVENAVRAGKEKREQKKAAEQAAQEQPQADQPQPAEAADQAEEQDEADKPSYEEILQNLQDIVDSNEEAKSDDQALEDFIDSQEKKNQEQAQQVQKNDDDLKKMLGDDEKKGGGEKNGDDPFTHAMNEKKGKDGDSSDKSNDSSDEDTREK